MPQRDDAHRRACREHGFDVESLHVGSCRHRGVEVEAVATDHGLDAASIGSEGCLVPFEPFLPAPAELQQQAARGEEGYPAVGTNREPERPVRRGTAEREYDIAGSKGSGGADGRYCTRVPRRYQERVSPATASLILDCFSSISYVPMRMATAFLLVFREVLEAVLVVGIILGYLERTGRGALSRYVWIGVGAGVAASAAGAFAFERLAGGFEGRAEELFEAVTMLTGAALLTTAIVWLAHAARRAEVEQAIESRLSGPFRAG